MQNFKIHLKYKYNIYIIIYMEYIQDIFLTAAGASCLGGLMHLQQVIVYKNPASPGYNNIFSLEIKMAEIERERECAKSPDTVSCSVLSAVLVYMFKGSGNILINLAYLYGQLQITVMHDILETLNWEKMLKR